MNNQSVGFVGGGRVTRIILEGWERANALPVKIVVSDCNRDALAKLSSRFPHVQTASESRAPAAQDVVVLAVHPPVLAEVAAGITGGLKPNAVVLSLAPKFTIAKITELLGGFARVVRMIPNAPSIMNLGYNPVAFSTALAAAEKLTITNLLAPLGECPEIAEAKLEGYALLTGMGPTYLWFQLQALREMAVGFGLSDADLVPAMKRMVCGATRTLLESGLQPAEVMDLIPVKPLAEMEPQIKELYRTRLPALFQKIKP
jgi:pyrroline-5-carboxylate reductase